jgi:hypothetical protein
MRDRTAFLVFLLLALAFLVLLLVAVGPWGAGTPRPTELTPATGR